MDCGAEGGGDGGGVRGRSGGEGLVVGFVALEGGGEEGGGVDASGEEVLEAVVEVDLGERRDWHAGELLADGIYWIWANCCDLSGTYDSSAQVLTCSWGT